MRLLTTLAIASLITTTAYAQDENELRSAFEGRTVVVKIDMPATSQGVDIHPEQERPLDYDRYGDRLRRTGIALEAGGATVITTIKLKDDLIEFQLGGGGYGTFGDPSPGSVYVPRAPKTNRERELERQVKRETDSARKRRMEGELRDLRRERERDNRLARVIEEQARADRQARIQDLRLQGGSRFNIRYDDAVPPGLTADAVMEILAEYVDFSDGAAAADVDAPGGAIWKGMALEDAEDQLGPATDRSERLEGALTVVTLVFLADDERISAEFVEDVLIRYSISSR